MSLSPAHLTKLKTNLKLSIERLKLLHSKKTSQTKAAAREIGELLRQGKRESARIRVENIIREDYLMEALEIMEIYCDVLLTRFGLIESLRRLDPAIEEAVHTVIYAAPRLADVRELMVIRDLLIVKFGKDVGILASENRYETVSSKIVTKLQLQTPPLSLVQSYLIQIAKQYNIPFEPDPIDAIEEFDFGDVAGDLTPPNMELTAVVHPHLQLDQVDWDLDPALLLLLFPRLQGKDHSMGTSLSLYLQAHQ
ncbi:DUF292-domain-containing protein [Gonapodya prolifera JEL478]|uniref:DUF292-domain-containing protein n=1 Tax=Gonapodya prolifera (strain JEL478) TaxID=1344416 RepID=A0A139B0N0_GONPJ|nr:DUF292-domain-containing protein [Gonapodya prolifera JEL478]|eukprot:KXS22534.1 DUF292-domain-containing protein [Gonapodya prolifera JEL478]